MINHSDFIGRIGKDPELMHTTDGRAYVFASVATESHWKDQEGHNKKRTDWVPCVLWGKQAESFAQYAKKGRLLYIEAQYRTSVTVNPDGTKRYNHGFSVNRYVFLDSQKIEDTTAEVVESFDPEIAPETETTTHTAM